MNNMKLRHGIFRIIVVQNKHKCVYHKILMNFCAYPNRMLGSNFPLTIMVVQP